MSLIYSSLSDCQRHLAGIEAIDYFFANNMVKLFNDFNQVTDEEKPQLYHTLLALQWYLRQGHTCLPLETISRETLWQDETQKRNPLQPESDFATGFSFADATSLNAAINKLLNSGCLIIY